MVQRTKRPKVEERSRDRVLWGGIHEVKIEQIFDTQGLQLKNCVRYGLNVKLVLESKFGVEMERFSWSCTSSTAGSLGSIGLRDRRDLQRVHAHTRIVDFELGKA